MKEHVRFLSQEIDNNLKPTGSIILRPRMLSRDRLIATQSGLKINNDGEQESVKVKVLSKIYSKYISGQLHDQQN